MKQQQVVTALVQLDEMHGIAAVHLALPVVSPQQF